MTQDEIKDIVEIFNEDETPHLFFAETDDGVSISVRCSGDDLYNYLTSLISVQPAFRDVILAVASENRHVGQTVNPKMLN